MTRIRIDTVQAENVALRLTRVGYRLHEIRWQLNHAIGQLDLGVWEGTSRARIESQLSRIDPKARELADLLDELGRKLMHVANVFEQRDGEAARAFGDMTWVNFTQKIGMEAGTAVAGLVGRFFGGSGGDLSTPPRDMRDLYNMIKCKGNEYPIKIIQIGENDYLVLIDGTREWAEENNRTNAILSFWGMQGDYEARAKQFILDSDIPELANIHFAGHSQGGMVANGLADDQDFLDRYTVKSVTTFGAPVNVRPNPKVEYCRYEAFGDFIPDLQGYGLGDPLVWASNRLSQNPVFTLGHGSYGDRFSTLAGEPLPSSFSVADWSIYSLYPESKDETSGIGQLAQLGIGSTLGVLDISIESTFDSPVWQMGEKTDLIPESIRTEVDRYTDRFYRSTLTTTPAVADAAVDAGVQAVDAVAGATGQAVNTIVDLGGQAVDSVVDTGGSILDFIL